MRWSDIVETCDKLGLSRAEMARRAGISESAVVKGLRRNSKLRGPTRRVIEQVLEEVLREIEAAA